MVAGLCHSDSAVTVLDKGYTSTVLLSSSPYGYSSEKGTKIRQWDKSISKELLNNSHRAVFIQLSRDP